MADSTSFARMTIHTRHVEEVITHALSRAVAIEFGAVSWETVWYTMWGHEQAPYPHQKADAINAATKYLHVEFRSDRVGDLLAIADRSEDTPIFTTVPGADFEWTTEAMDSIDFARCDRCGIAHRRIKVYVLKTANGQEQLGGTCATGAAERLKMMLAFLNELRTLMGGHGDDFIGGQGGPATHGYPRQLLVLAELSIREQGYAKSDSDWSTKSDVLHGLRILGETSLRAEVLREQMAEVDSEQLLKDVNAWLETQDDSSFVRNMRTALDTGLLKLVGTLAYAPEAVRRHKERLKAQEGQAVPTVYVHTDDTNVARLTTFTADELHMSTKVYAKALDGHLSKVNRKKLDRCMAGEWTVMSRRPTVSQWTGYTTTYVKFQRADGAQVTWPASGLPDLDVGDTYRLQAQMGELRQSERWGDTQQVKRVTLFT